MADATLLFFFLQLRQLCLMIFLFFLAQRFEICKPLTQLQDLCLHVGLLHLLQLQLLQLGGLFLLRLSRVFFVVLQ